MEFEFFCFLSCCTDRFFLRLLSQPAVLQRLESVVSNIVRFSAQSGGNSLSELKWPLSDRGNAACAAFVEALSTTVECFPHRRGPSVH